MTEKIFSIESYSALDIYGVNDRNVQLIRNGFPLLKFVIRGEFIKVIGEENEIEQFDRKFSAMLLHYDKFGKLTERDVEQIIGQAEDPGYDQVGEMASDILLHGRQGNLIKARTANQQKLVESTEKNDLVFAIGPAGTGKTYTAVALAVRALKNREVKRIILTRPAVEAGENLGFLPGDLKDKLDPYLQPLYDALRDMIPTQKLLSYMEDGTIEIAPIAFMRGRTLDNVFAILDEAQNSTIPQMKMFLTRMGKAAKFIVTGDITQIDLPGNQTSGLVHASEILRDIPGIGFVILDESDIIRHKLVARVLKAYHEKR
ncbi:MAG TPA: PhoH family protein [Bacteroidales bacterium]|nr:PhoH family protein [Bacteroidales bacterium]HNS47599.1 PhoH family protein [Bacteroidales bacterium]